MYLPLCYHDKNDEFFVHLFFCWGQAFAFCKRTTARFRWNPLKTHQKKEERITNMLLFCVLATFDAGIITCKIRVLQFPLGSGWSFSSQWKRFIFKYHFFSVFHSLCVVCAVRLRCKCKMWQKLWNGIRKLRVSIKATFRGNRLKPWNDDWKVTTKYSFAHSPFRSAFVFLEMKASE